MKVTTVRGGGGKCFASLVAGWELEGRDRWFSGIYGFVYRFSHLVTEVTHEVLPSFGVGGVGVSPRRCRFGGTRDRRSAGIYGIAYRISHFITSVTYEKLLSFGVGGMFSLSLNSEIRPMAGGFL